jgi:hypothetical protein
MFEFVNLFLHDSATFCFTLIFIGLIVGGVICTVNIK